MADHFVFIASGGRTGTNYFGEQLQHCIEDCWSEHEPDMFAGFNSLTAERIRRFGFAHVIGRRVLGRAGLRVIGTRYLKGDIPFEEVAVQLRRERRKYHEMTTQSLLVESYSRWWIFADRLDEVFPDCKVLGIVRDPRHWIASWMQRNPGKGPEYLSHMLPPGPIVPAAVGDAKYADRWRDLSVVGKLAWHWNLTNSTLQAASEKTANVRIFRFEDLFSGETPHLQEMAEFASSFPDRQFRVRTIEPLMVPKKNASSAKPDDWTFWSAEDTAIVDEIAGETMSKFGYAPLTAG